MTTRALRYYRFAKASQWDSCLLHGMALCPREGVRLRSRLGRRPFRVAGSESEHVSRIAIGPAGMTLFRVDAMRANAVSSLFLMPDADTVVGPLDVDPALVSARRWVLGRHWLWAVQEKASVVERYERDSFAHDASVDVAALSERHGVAGPVEVLDIATDARDGIWVLGCSAAQTFFLLHVDCHGRAAGLLLVTCALARPTQLGCLSAGASLALLSEDRRFVAFVATRDGSVERRLLLPGIAPGFTAHAIVTDASRRLVLTGSRNNGAATRFAALVLDGRGDLLETFPDAETDLSDLGALSSTAREVAVGVDGDVLWFGTADGLYRLDASERAKPRESDGTLITPLLLSPESEIGRGFLRAELELALPAGAVLEADVATTDDARVAEQAATIARDPNLSPGQKQRELWNALEPQPERHFSITGPNLKGVALAIPLLESKRRFLALRLRVVTPPGAPPAVLTELRVLYPNLTIANQLPAIFNDERIDAAQFLRRLVGVLETTTQGLDQKIQRIGSYLEPATTDPTWFDYLARWLDLPWDDALPDASKLRLLEVSGELIDRRGTRKGLDLLLRALLGANGSARISDMTVDHPPIRLGGRGRPGRALPALLAGAPPSVPLLGGKATLGAARLPCKPTDADPLRALRACVVVAIAATRETQRQLNGLLPALLAQYLPAGIGLSIRWSICAQPGAEDGELILDANGPGSLGDDSVLGRVVLAGRAASRLGDGEIDESFRLE